MNEEISRYSLQDFGISVPERLIAQYPSPKREQSRLLVYGIRSGMIVDDRFYNIKNYIHPNDCLVYNDAKVINARLEGRKKETGAQLEILLLRQQSATEWDCLIRPARRVKKMTEISVVSELNINLTVVVLAAFGEGRFRVRFSRAVDYEDLKRVGTVPLPKYIRRPSEEIDEIRYQTVFSQKYGAVASPTAGLHFTEEIVEEIRRKGAYWIPITLHVDWGTFRPVRETDYRQHSIHSEGYEISPESADAINRSIDEKRRILCVGTTSVRALESAAGGRGERRVSDGRGETDLYIYPGYRFRLVEGMITNFHLPDSTLILLVMAFAGVDGIRKAYLHAVREGYRFFSYGDAMLLIKD
jgi:S-adenosylmethionine:tRNA ribosyltransferase-isomerase